MSFNSQQDNSQESNLLAEDAPPANAASPKTEAVNATDLFSEHLHKPRRRHRGSRDAQSQPVNLHIPAWLMVICAFAMGTTMGVLVMKQRYAADKVIVAVGGETIRAQDFYPRLEAAAGPQVLRQMVAETVARQYAQQRQQWPTPDEIQSKAAQIKAQSAFASVMQRPPAKEQVQQMAQAQSLQERLLTPGVDVTDAEAQAYYRAQTDPRNPAARFFHPEAVRMAVIVTPSEQEARQAESALQRGTAFAEAAKTYSKDRSAAQGGELPPILRGRTPARQVRGLEDVIFRLNPAETTRPQKVLGAWWIITCLEKLPAQTLPFAQVQAQCRQEARLLKAQRIQGAQVKADFDKFSRSVPVQVFWERYAASVLDQQHRPAPGKL